MIEIVFSNKGLKGRGLCLHPRVQLKHLGTMYVVDETLFPR